MQPKSTYVNVPGGPRLHLANWSEGETACLLIHGFGDGCHIWNELAPQISHFHRTIAVDLRGHGGSSWDPNARYDALEHSADIAYVVRGIDSPKLVLIGHSLGAEVAIHVATMCARRIHGLVIVDYGPSIESAIIRQIRADFRAAHQVYPSVCAYAQYLHEQRPLARPGLLQKLAIESLVARANGEYVLKTDPKMVSSRLEEAEGQVEQVGVWDALKSMQWPTLVVRAEGSAVLTRAVASRMIELLPNGTLESVRMAGHAVMIDNPDGLASAVVPFLSRLFEQSQFGACRTSVEDRQVASPAAPIQEMHAGDA